MLRCGSIASHPRFITPCFSLTPSSLCASPDAGSLHPASSVLALRNSPPFTCRYLLTLLSDEIFLVPSASWSCCTFAFIYNHTSEMSPTNSSGNLSIALQHFPQITHLKLNPDVLTVELIFLTSSPFSGALNIVGFSSFLKCFPLLVFIISDCCFQSEHISSVWASAAFSFSRGLVLPFSALFLPLHTQRGYPTLLSTFLWIRPQIVLKPNLPCRLWNHIFNSQLYLLSAQVHNWPSYLIFLLSPNPQPQQILKGIAIWFPFFSHLDLKLQILLWLITLLCLWLQFSCQVMLAWTISPLNHCSVFPARPFLISVIPPFHVYEIDLFQNFKLIRLFIQWVFNISSWQI